jgi:hypothetical protein
MAATTRIAGHGAKKPLLDGDRPSRSSRFCNGGKFDVYLIDAE